MADDGKTDEVVSKLQAEAASARALTRVLRTMRAPAVAQLDVAGYCIGRACSSGVTLAQLAAWFEAQVAALKSLGAE